MSLDRINSSSEKDHKKQQKEKADKVKSGGNNIPNPKFDKGLNVFHLLPPVGEMAWPVTRKYIHYNPFHACGRDDPAKDFEKDEWVEDNEFSNCYRCQKAFNTWEEQGKPKGSHNRVYQKFLTDMQNTYDLIQVVDLTAFFKYDSRGTGAKLDKAKFDQWWDTFLDVAGQQDEFTSLDDLPEEMPEDMKISALNFPTFITCPCKKTDLGGSIRSTYSEQKGDNEYENKDIVDPCCRPFSDLFQVDVDHTGTFQAGGQERNSKSYDVKVTKDRNTDGLDIPAPTEGSRYWEIIAERALDLEDPKCLEDDPTLEERAQSLEKLSDDEMKKYLNESGHSFYVESNEGGNAEESADSDETFSDVDENMSEEKEQEVQQLKNAMHSDDSGSDDDVFEGEEIPH